MLPVAHLGHTHGDQHEAGGGEQLVGDAEDRHHRVDAAVRVGHAHPQQSAPQRGGDQRGDDVAGLPGRVGELLELAHVAEHFADLVAGHAGAVVHGGQDEQGFEHDGEMVPEGHRVVAAQVGLEEVGHAHGERGGGTGAGDDGGLADVGGGLLKRRGAFVGLGRAVLVHGIPGDLHLVAFDVGDLHRLHGLDGGIGLFARRGGGGDAHAGCGGDLCGGHVGGEVHALRDGDRGDQRDDGGERFDEHRTVADHANLVLLLHGLRGQAGAHRAVEAREGTAGDGDEQERE